MTLQRNEHGMEECHVRMELLNSNWWARRWHGMAGHAAPLRCQAPTLQQRPILAGGNKHNEAEASKGVPHLRYCVPTSLPCRFSVVGSTFCGR